MMSILQKIVFVITTLAIFAPIYAMADVVETSLSNAQFIPTIEVGGNANGYNRIVTRNLTYYIRVKSRKPENDRELLETRLRIEDTVVEFRIGDNIYPVTIPVTNIRNNGNADSRLSPINLCNYELGRNSGADREAISKAGVTITRNSAYWVGASAKWKMELRGVGTFIDEYKRTWHAEYLYVPVRIECKPLVAPDPAPATEPTSVNLRVMQQGNSCPKEVEVRALIRYTGPATAKFRFKVDGELSELVEIKARRVERKPKPGRLPGSNDYYLVERVKTYKLDPGQHHFRIEVRGGHKSEVKTKTIDCPPFKVTNATLEYAQTGGNACPHQVWETAKFYTNRPGDVSYEIKREPGNHATIMLPRTGTVKSVRHGNEYYAVAQKYWKELYATDTRMKAYATGTPVASSWTQLLVNCKDQREEQRKPKLSLKVAPMNVKRVGDDVCPTQLRLTGRFDVGQAFQGQSIFVGPGWLSRKTDIKFDKAGGRSIVATYPINWTGDVGNNLSSGSNQPKRQTINFKMNVANVHNKLVSTTSKQIKIICKKPTPVTGTAGDLTTTSDPAAAPVELVCKGGKIKGKKCTCSSKKDLKKLGKRKFACIAKPVRANPEPQPPAISCQGGKVKNGKCKCGANKDVKKLAKRKFACVAKPVRANPEPAAKKAALICKKGKIKAGKCTCGKKRKLKKLGKRNFACVKRK